MLASTLVRRAAWSAPRMRHCSSVIVCTRSFMTPAVEPTERRKITVLPGDGIGPEIVSSVMGVFQAANAPVDWEIFNVPLKTEASHHVGQQIAQEVIASISRNKVALKGPFYTPLLSGARSRNTELRKALDLYAHVIPAKNIPGITTRHQSVPIDLVVVRENTQGEYSGLEQELTPGVVQSLKIITRDSSLRIAKYAFEYARKEKRKKVTAIHKANIQKFTDGLFLEVCREVSKGYPDIQFSDMIIDNCCMQLVMKPEQFDVMVTPNLYGNLVANLAAGLVGGPGLIPGANLGERIAIFETGAHHVASDIAGQNKANPTGILLSSTMMLRHLGLALHAAAIETAINSVFAEKTVRTADVGGSSSTKEFTKAIIDKLVAPK